MATEANAAWLEWQASERDWALAVLSGADWATERMALNGYRRTAHRAYITHLDTMGDPQP
jgi:hypothetical protein